MNWTVAERDWLKANAHLGLKACAKYLGRTEYSLLGYRARKLPSVRFRKIFRFDLEAEGYALWQAGWIDKQIARKFGCCKGTVWRWRRKRKLPPVAPTGSEEWYASQPRLIARKADVFRLWEQGLTDGQMAAVWGCHYQAAWQRRKRAGLPQNKVRQKT